MKEERDENENGKLRNSVLTPSRLKNKLLTEEEAANTVLFGNKSGKEVVAMCDVSV